MTQHPLRLILFSRYPAPGHTKTRLIPALGADEAAALHRALTERLVRQVALLRHAELEVRFAGCELAEMRRWLGPVAAAVGVHAARFVPQGPGDLGARMLRGFEDAQAQGMARALLFGADIPRLDAAVLQRATDALDHADVVLGPASDGGYYLVGAKAPHPALFSAILWSTPEVRTQTLRRAAAAALRVALVDELADLDEPDDLATLASLPELARWTR